VTSPRVKWSTQIAPEALQALKDLAKSEGRQIQSLVDEAIADVVEKHRSGRPRPHVMAAYRTSLERFGPLYKKLAE
jgi:hypothetical protein